MQARSVATSHQTPSTSFGDEAGAPKGRIVRAGQEEAGP